MYYAIKFVYSELRFYAKYVIRDSLAMEIHHTNCIYMEFWKKMTFAGTFFDTTENGVNIDAESI